MSEAMTEILAFLKDIGGFAALALGLVLTVRNIKKTSPGFAREQWQKAVDDKLDKDYRRINELERERESDKRHRTDFERLVLRSLMEINAHLGMCKNNDNAAAMTAVNTNIENFLINQYE